MSGLVRRRVLITLEIADFEASPIKHQRQSNKDAAYAIARTLKKLAAEIEKRPRSDGSKPAGGYRPGAYKASWRSAIVRWTLVCLYCKRDFWSRKPRRQYCGPKCKKWAMRRAMQRRRAAGWKPPLKVKDDDSRYQARHHHPEDYHGDRGFQADEATQLAAISRAGPLGGKRARGRPRKHP